MKTLTEPTKKVILLATDGEPNCGASMPDGGGVVPDVMIEDVAGATAAVAAANAAGFPVYVIGIGPSVANLNKLAKAGGGTSEYYPATSAEQLTAALSSISKLAGSCTFTADSEPPDQENIAVYVNKQKVEKDSDNGWEFGASSQEIVLTGSYCKQMSTGDEANVQILFGCPGAPPFPVWIP
jgi:hypothetical protein